MFSSSDFISLGADLNRMVSGFQQAKFMEYGIILPRLIHVLKNILWLSNWFAIVNKHRDFIMNWILL